MSKWANLIINIYCLFLNLVLVHTRNTRNELACLMGVIFLVIAIIVVEVVIVSSSSTSLSLLSSSLFLTWVKVTLHRRLFTPVGSI